MLTGTGWIGKVALLRALLSLKTPELRDAVYSFVKGELQRGIVDHGYFDTPLAVLWSTVQEEFIVKAQVSLRQEEAGARGIRDPLKLGEAVEQILSTLNVEHVHNLR